MHQKQMLESTARKGSGKRSMILKLLGNMQARELAVICPKSPLLLPTISPVLPVLLLVEPARPCCDAAASEGGPEVGNNPCDDGADCTAGTGARALPDCARGGSKMCCSGPRTPPSICKEELRHLHVLHTFQNSVALQDVESTFGLHGVSFKALFYPAV